MKVKVSRIRHPLACFQGEISVNDERTAHAEEVKLAFDYYPVIEPEEEFSSKKVQANGNGIHLEVKSSNGSNGNPTDQKVPSRFVKYEPKS
jgi:hypothetical protein